MEPLIKKVIGRSLKEQFEDRDLKAIRLSILGSWVIMWGLGLILGIELVRRGVVPL